MDDFIEFALSLLPTFHLTFLDMRYGGKYEKKVISGHLFPCFAVEYRDKWKMWPGIR